MKCPHLKTRKYLKKMRKNDMEDDVIFIKQVPVHPRDRLARATPPKKKNEVTFMKQVPFHPRYRLKKKTEILKHPRDRLKTKDLQVAMDNVSALMEGKFNFSPEQFLNKTVLFDVSKVNEKKIIERIIENLSKDNDELYIVHEPAQMHFR